MMLAAMITLIVLALQAESRLICALLFLMALALFPFIVARAFQDDACAYVRPLACSSLRGLEAVAGDT